MNKKLIESAKNNSDGCALRQARKRLRRATGAEVCAPVELSAETLAMLRDITDGAFVELSGHARKQEQAKVLKDLLDKLAKQWHAGELPEQSLMLDYRYCDE
jgi:hypothetical protein